MLPLQTDKYSLETLFRLMMESVMFYPEGIHQGKTVNTFAVVSRYNELNDKNLGKSIRDYDKPFFYSKSWAREQYNPSDINFIYPLFICYEVGHNYNKFFYSSNPSGKEKERILEIAVLDEFFENIEESDPYRYRTVNDIFLQTEKLLDGCLNYLKNVVAATYLIGLDSFSGFYNKAHLDSLVTSGDIDSYTVDSERGFILRMTDSGQSLRGRRWEGGINNIFGTTLQLRYKTRCDDNVITPNFDVVDNVRGLDR